MKDFRTTLQVILLIGLTVMGAICLEIIIWFQMKVRGKKNFNKIL